MRLAALLPRTAVSASPCSSPAVILPAATGPAVTGSFLPLGLVAALALIAGACAPDVGVPQDEWASTYGTEGDPAPPKKVVRLVWADGKTDYPGFCQGRILSAFACSSDHPACKEAILAGVRQWLAPFDVEVTDQSPLNPLITVVLAPDGSEACGTPGLLGEALIDAPATASWSNIWGAGWLPDNEVIENIAHELGHGIGGLQHTTSPADVMFHAGPTGATSYADGWVERTAGEPQNDFRAMLAVLGPHGGAQ